MKIGIDGSRAFIKNRTGIEEYSYQVIKHLTQEIINDHVVLYIRKNQKIDFALPKNWRVKTIKFYYFWTQLGLSLEMLLHPVNILFIPAHTVPFIHPAQTIVTIHGLEYEFCPKAYSFWEKIYMRASIKKSCQWASKIISVSENTKKDLINLYKVLKDKIKVIYEGPGPSIDITSNESFKFQISNFQPYLLFIGRLEERKNIVGIIKAFEILKEKYKVSHNLILAGNPNHGFVRIKEKIENSLYGKNIVLMGFVKSEEKTELLKKADVFLFPSFYEGFGLPILEAQSVNVPVVTSNVSSIPEVADGSALLIDPNNAEDMADSVYKIISDKNFRNDIIRKGQENVQRFSWEKCAEEIARLFK